jgi:hypothetical protein
MVAVVVEQTVRDLALKLSDATDCRVLVETDRRTMLGREVVELRIFLRQPPYLMTADQWVRMYRNRLAAVFGLAGLELAADEWFTPSQRFPSCGCWITRPAADRN